MINILLDLVSYQEMQSFQIVKICIASGICLGNDPGGWTHSSPETSWSSLAEGLVWFANLAVGEILEQCGISGALELLCGRYPGANNALFDWLGAKALP